MRSAGDQRRENAGGGGAARRIEQHRNRAPLGIDLLTDTRFGRYVNNLHPGDIFYWVACLGGACLLLIKATI